MHNNTLDAAAVLGKLGIPQAFDNQPPLWAEAMTAMPTTPTTIPFLERHKLSQRRAQVGLGAERDAALLAMAATIAADPHLCAFAWYLHWRVFVAVQQGAPWGTPDLTEYLGDRSGLFYQLVTLGFVEALQQWHAHLGYPEQVTHDTLQQIAAFESYHLSGTGLPGLYARHLMWLNCYLVGPYVRLGRFEYQMQAAGGNVEVWRRNADGQLLALAPHGAHIDSNGLIADAADAATWLSTRQDGDNQTSAFPIHPAGHVLHQRVTLAHREWSPLLQKGANVLNMHIPAGGNMNWKAITDSFRRAHAFFAEHHPNQPIVGAMLGTWFLDPQLNSLLPAEANPLRLQRACYLFPTPAAQGGLWFIFQRPMDETAPTDLPRKTSLQRILADFLATGNKWHGGSMFVPQEDMDDLREGRYTAAFATLAKELNIAL